MAVTQNDVLAIAPELRHVSDPNRFTVAISDAYAELDATLFGAQLDLIVKKVVAHRITLQERYVASNGGRGALTGNTAEGLSATFAPPAALKEGVPPEFSETVYGIQAWGLMRSFVLPLVL